MYAYCYAEDLSQVVLMLAAASLMHFPKGYISVAPPPFYLYSHGQ